MFRALGFGVSAFRVWGFRFFRFFGFGALGFRISGVLRFDAT